MKTETKNHLQTTAAFLLMLAIIVLIAWSMNSCTCRSSRPTWEVYNADRRAYADSIIQELQKDTIKWDAFLECSKYEGDAGCDSCFQLIFGFPIPE